MSSSLKVEVIFRWQTICQRRRVWLIILVILGSIQQSKGQQDPQFSQYMFNYTFTNPGYAGSSDLLRAVVQNRNQWLGFPGAPKTTVVSADMPLKIISPKDGIAINLSLDQIGYYTDILYKVGYSYPISIGNNDLRVGISLGAYNKQLSPDWDGDFESDDPAIPTTKINTISFDSDLGFFYRSKKYYLCMAITHINGTKFDYGSGQAIEIDRHYYISGGYKHKVNNPNIGWISSLLGKAVAGTFQLDLSSIVKVNDKYWGGVSYRLQDAIIIIAGAKLTRDIKLGYSYDMTTSAISQYSSGSHEFMITYTTKVFGNKNTNKRESIRFL